MFIRSRLGYALASLFVLGLATALLALFAAVLAYRHLPALDALTNYQPRIPLRVYTTDGILIGEFGEERRAPVTIAAVPLKLRQAILAAEDDRFYQHGGIDYLSVLRAAAANLTGRGELQGASTITMQVARNFFLSRERTFMRKFYEALLALKIEHDLSKDQILELYINKIYLGERAYGFAAAADIYFAKPLGELNLAQMAVLAGLPKAPARDNPIVSPARAKQRQEHVLRRMRELNYVPDADTQAALQTPLQIRTRGHRFAVDADFVAEAVRQVMVERYQDTAYVKGFNVYTTIRSIDQIAANEAVRQGVLDYDRRHGYRGPEGFVEFPSDHARLDDALRSALRDVDEVDGLKPAVVLSASPKAAQVRLKSGELIELRDDGLRFAQEALSVKADLRHRVRRGAIVRVTEDTKGHWQIAQVPEVEAALVSIDPQQGAVRALVGGFDFTRNQFNHVTQALRQPGSSFKPFIYSAALEKGFTPATIIDDAPITFDPIETGLKEWVPENYDRDFLGPISMRTALVKSRNVVSIRILQAIGIPYARDYVTRFGFSAAQVPPYLAMVLGVGSVTPLQMAEGYSVFANSGYRISAYFIERVVDREGRVLAQAAPIRAGDETLRVIDSRNAFIMTSMLRDVIGHGTGARALQLARHDLAGKTGSTNEFTDAWFDGFNSQLVAVAWIGFDRPRSLGSNEVGAQAALPIWMKYVGAVLKGKPEVTPPIPTGIVQVTVDPSTGLAPADAEAGVPEYFYQEYAPVSEGREQGLGPDESERSAGQTSKPPL
jgi:penicillin-binding protein 1A